MPLHAASCSKADLQARDTLAIIKKAFGPDEFTRDHAARALGLTDAAASRRLKPLISLGLVSQDRNTRPYKHKRTDLTPEDTADLGLPSVDDVRARCESAVSAACSPDSAHTGPNPRSNNDLSVRDDSARCAHGYEDCERAPTVREPAHAQSVVDTRVTANVRSDGRTTGDTPPDARGETAA